MISVQSFVYKRLIFIKKYLQFLQYFSQFRAMFIFVELSLSTSVHSRANKFNLSGNRFRKLRMKKNVFFSLKYSNEKEMIHFPELITG
jgi:hypothetical protein